MQSGCGVDYNPELRRPSELLFQLLFQLSSETGVTSVFFPSPGAKQDRVYPANFRVPLLFVLPSSSVLSCTSSSLTHSKKTERGRYFFV